MAKKESVNNTNSAKFHKAMKQVEDSQKKQKKLADSMAKKLGMVKEDGQN